MYSVQIYVHESSEEQLAHLLDYPPVPKSSVLNFVGRFYGEKILSVLERTRIEEIWGERLTRFQTRILLAAAGHCASLETLQECLEGKSEMDIRSCVQKTYPHLLGRVKKVSELPQAELDLWMKIFRSPFQMLLKHPRSLWEEIEPDFEQKGRLGNRPLSGLETRCMALTRMDAATVRKYQNPDEANLDLSSAETVAKFVGYMKPETSEEEEKVRPLLMTACALHPKRIVHYALQEALHKEGLHAYLWLPLYDKGAEAILVFRGTNGPQSLSRSCFEPQGIGKETFLKYAPRMLKWVSTLCKRAPTSLLLTGHSLGGIDAERMLVELIDSIARGNLDQIVNLRVRTFAAPLLDEETALRYQSLLKRLKELPKAPKIDLICAQRDTDLVPRAGDFGLTGSTLMLVADPKTRLNPHVAHSGPFFTIDGDLTSGSYVVVNAEGLQTAIERIYAETTERDEEEWVIVQESVRRVAEQFQALQIEYIQFHGAQVGLRQRSRVILFLSEQVLNRLIRMIGALSLSSAKSAQGVSSPSDPSGRS